ncbi:hypothetical protein C7H09_00120 [Marinobacter fuscus]|uniref:Glycosyl transferase family 1 domain-containing protein n=1 Tax=Marinobacter fuscus TaxID=2109942 RepID=A0A2T1KW39_9GAMM|nr:glycosyltransferase [Marinobacter fuscus]PSF14296.1 hypothetical protein C7H09_00120 [Marinobacter fuscus]
MTKGFYQSFENIHRGSEEGVTRRLGAYQPLLDALHTSLPDSPVADLGCGRGEWLQLLNQAGFAAEGVDTDPDMLATCQEKGLAVHGTDALAFLKQAPDNHYAMVSAFHLVEHIPFEALNTLVQEAYRALCPGGVLLLETPNPENPLIGACYFYMDPTHVKPLPPALLQFVADFNGFEPSRIWRMNEADGLRNQAPSLSTVLKASSPDYALLAQKPGHAEATANLQSLFQEIRGITLEELATRYDNRQTETTEHLERLIQAEVAHVAAQMHQLLTQQQAEMHELRQQNQALTTQTEADRQKLQQQESLLNTTRQLQAIHDEKLRTLAILTGILRPVDKLARNARNYLAKLRHASRNGTFYQWQLIKLLKALGLTRQATARAASLGLTLDGPPVHTHSTSQNTGSDTATGPLTIIQQALVRRLSLAHGQTVAAGSAQNQTLCIDGHFSGSYSLAAVNRALVMALADAPGLTLALLPREGEPTNQIHSAPEHQLDRMRPLVATRPARGDIAIYHHYPVIENPEPAQGTPILMFFWEESQVPEDTIRQINEHYAGVLVTSWVVKKALIDSGCHKPVCIVPLPLDDGLPVPPGPASGQPFRFLHVSSCFPRKGADVLLKAFARLLEQHQDLELVIKTFPNPHNTVAEQIKAWIPENRQARVTLVMEDYSEADMDRLYRSAHAVVLPSRGEGLNLPAIEASRYGLPVITTGYGAHTDFLKGKGVRFVNYRFAPSGSHLQTPGSVWVNPDPEDLREQCEAILEQLRNGSLNTRDTHQAITDTFFSENAKQRLASNLARFAAPRTKPAERPIILMTTWGEACGIAEYSRYLAQELHDAGAELEVWAPKHLANPGQAPMANQLRGIQCCWQPASTVLPDALATAPETVWIQYHPGFFSLSARLEQMIETATRAGHLRFITLHATLPLLQLPEAERAQTARTLNAFYRVIVHTPNDMNVLKTLGVVDNVALLPQGVTRPVKAPAHAVDGEFTVGCFGFLFPHKGVMELINAFAQFRNANPEAASARLLLLNSLHSNPESAEYEQQCRARIRELGLEQVTEFCSEFLEEQQVAERLASCNLLILPYRETPESSSAAVRTAVACCPTVAVTPARIFTEVRDATLTLPGFGIEHILQVIEQTWSQQNRQQLEQVHQARADWLAEHQWPRVAQRHHQLINAGITDTDWLSHKESDA